MDGLIEIVTGTLGGGKTLFAVERFVAHIMKGGWVFTNVEFYEEKIREYLAENYLVFDAKRLVRLTGCMSDFHTQIARGNDDMLVMVVIDEAHFDFNARNWKQVNQDLLDFNTLVRKLDINLLYITQHYKNLDAQFVRMASRIWTCRNLTQMEFMWFFKFPFAIYFRVPADPARGTGKGTRMTPEMAWGSFAYPLYKSKALLGASAEKLGKLKVAVATPLERIPRSKISIWPEMAAALCASFYAFL